MHLYKQLSRRQDVFDATYPVSDTRTHTQIYIFETCRRQYIWIINNEKTVHLVGSHYTYYKRHNPSPLHTVCFSNRIPSFIRTSSYFIIKGSLPEPQLSDWRISLCLAPVNICSSHSQPTIKAFRDTSLQPQTQDELRRTPDKKVLISGNNKNPSLFCRILASSAGTQPIIQRVQGVLPRT